MVHYSMLIYKLQAAKKIFKMRCSNEIFDETERHDPSSCLSLSGRGGQDNKRKDCGECKDKSRLYPSADVCVKKGGLITSDRGQANAALTRNVDRITMLDIYRAVEGEKPLLHLDIHTNPECGVGVNIQLAIGDFYREVQDAAEQKMRKITLKDIIERYYEKAETAEQEFADLTAVMTNQTAWK